MSHDEDMERAWDLLEEGDVAGAEHLADKLDSADPGDPDVLLLLAACKREGGDFQEALKLLEQAAEADPEWATPELWIAEILSDDLDRLPDALQHAKAALDRAEEEDEFLESLALKAGLEIDLGKTKAAKETLAELPPLEAGATMAPEMAREFAQLLFEVGEVEQARSRFAVLVEADARDADAWHGLGTCAEAMEDEDAKRRAWLHTWDLDNQTPLAGERLSQDQMEELAEAALEELSERAQQLLQNVPVLIVDLPARDEVEKGLDPRLLGLFSGQAYPEGSSVGGEPQLTQILLFRKNLERVARDEDDLREQIRITLIHETGHFFGMSEEDLGEVGLD
jgi:predicted Zn-dependent protease with MMP-like domain